MQVAADAKHTGSGTFRPPVVRHRVEIAPKTIALLLAVAAGVWILGQLVAVLSVVTIALVLVGTFAPLVGWLERHGLIPFVGGYVASTPVVVAVIPNGTVVIVVVVGLMVLYQEFESRILVPRVYGRVLRLPPAVVLVALLVGGSLAGVLGALLALPIAAAIRMLIRELRLDLPGAAPVADDVLRRDDRASAAYEDLMEGTTVRDAVVIADEVASLVKESEPEPAR